MLVRSALGLAFLIVATANSVAWSNGHMGAQTPSPQEVLRSSNDRATLERAAAALARTGDQASLEQLERLLTEPAFLARLDDVGALETQHVAAVIAAFGDRTTPRVVALFERLAENPVFVSVSDRKGLVVDVLAAVVPMSDRTAAVLRRANDEGYFASNALLLMANGSPVALRLFESMVADKNQPVEVRVELLHRGLVPRRQQPALLRMAGRILESNPERAIALGVVESIFDYKQEWFGIESRMVKPAGWNGVSHEVGQAALAVADQALRRRDLTPGLRALVTQQRGTIAQAVAAPRR